MLLSIDKQPNAHLGCFHLVWKFLPHFNFISLEYIFMISIARSFVAPRCKAWMEIYNLEEFQIP